MHKPAILALLRLIKFTKTAWILFIRIGKYICVMIDTLEFNIDINSYVLLARQIILKQ